jgi:uncharacterized protein YndB with AHSA1/START domain
MNDRTHRASRLISASPERLFHAFTDPDEWLRWLPPGDARAQIDEFNLRPGGNYRMTLVFDEVTAGQGKSSANSDQVRGRFVEIHPNERLVQELEFASDDPRFAGTMRMSWCLLPASAGTKVSIIAENVPEGISAQDHVAGLNSSLEKLATLVE